jgi:hypothetical protein
MKATQSFFFKTLLVSSAMVLTTPSFFSGEDSIKESTSLSEKKLINLDAILDSFNSIDIKKNYEEYKKNQTFLDENGQFIHPEKGNAFDSLLKEIISLTKEIEGVNVFLNNFKVGEEYTVWSEVEKKQKNNASDMIKKLLENKEHQSYKNYFKEEDGVKIFDTESKGFQHTLSLNDDALCYRNGIVDQNALNDLKGMLVNRMLDQLDLQTRTEENLKEAAVKKLVCYQRLFAELVALSKASQRFISNVEKDLYTFYLEKEAQKHNYDVHAEKDIEHKKGLINENHVVDNDDANTKETKTKNVLSHEESIRSIKYKLEQSLKEIDDTIYKKDLDTKNTATTFIQALKDLTRPKGTFKFISIFTNQNRSSIDYHPFESYMENTDRQVGKRNLITAVLEKIKEDASSPKKTLDKLENNLLNITNYPYGDNEKKNNEEDYEPEVIIYSRKQNVKKSSTKSPKVTFEDIANTEISKTNALTKKQAKVIKNILNQEKKSFETLSFDTNKYHKELSQWVEKEMEETIDVNHKIFLSKLNTPEASLAELRLILGKGSYYSSSYNDELTQLSLNKAKEISSSVKTKHDAIKKKRKK